MIYNKLLYIFFLSFIFRNGNLKIFYNDLYVISYSENILCRC